MGLCRGLCNGELVVFGARVFRNPTYGLHCELQCNCIGQGESRAPAEAQKAQVKNLARIISLGASSTSAVFSSQTLIQRKDLRNTTVEVL